MLLKTRAAIWPPSLLAAGVASSLDSLLAADLAEFGVDRFLIFSASSAVWARAVVAHVGARGARLLVHGRPNLG